MSDNLPKKRMTLDSDNSKVCGVIGGISNYYDIDPFAPRVITLLAAFSGIFPFILPIYLVLWLVMERDSQ